MTSRRHGVKETTDPHPHAHTRTHTQTHTRTHTPALGLFKAALKAAIVLASPLNIGQVHLTAQTGLSSSRL